MDRIQTRRKPAKRSGPRPEPTHYVNVDLDIYSRARLDGLVEAMGKAVFALFVDGHGRKHHARLELAASRSDMTADQAIGRFVRVINRLPQAQRKLWDSATVREFNVGIEAGFEPHSFELRLRQRTVDAIAGVGGTVAVTVYAPNVGG